MPRAHHREGYDRGPIVFDGSAATTWSPNSQKTHVKWSRETIEDFSDTSRWAQISPCRRNGALSALLVVDCLMRTARTHEIRTKDFTALLRTHYKQIHWEPVTVGRLLSDLASASEFLMNITLDMTTQTFERKRDRDGFYYRLGQHYFATLWLAAIRNELTDHAREETRDPEVIWKGETQMTLAAAIVNAALDANGLDSISDLVQNAAKGS